jgi:hypothetical protein
MPVRMESIGIEKDLAALKEGGLFIIPKNLRRSRSVRLKATPNSLPQFSRHIPGDHTYAYHRVLPCGQRRGSRNVSCVGEEGARVKRANTKPPALRPVVGYLRIITIREIQ